MSLAVWSAVLAALALAQAVRQGPAATLGFSANRLARIAPVAKAPVYGALVGS